MGGDGLTSTTTVRRRRVDGWLAVVAGGAYVSLGPLAVLDPQDLERSLFRVMNGTSGPASVLRVPQQLGTPWLLLGLLPSLIGAYFMFWR